MHRRAVVCTRCGKRHHFTVTMTAKRIGTYAESLQRTPSAKFDSPQCRLRDIGRAQTLFLLRGYVRLEGWLRIDEVREPRLAIPFRVSGRQAVEHFREGASEI